MNEPQTEAGRRFVDPQQQPGWLQEGIAYALNPDAFTERILAIEAEASSQALDPEKLALALHEERSDRWGGCGSPGEAYEDHMTFHQTRAERIAAAYLRLASTDEEEAG